MIAFIYNNKRYATSDLQKKLKKMGISIDDINIVSYLKEQDVNTEKENISTFRFKNRKTNEEIISLYNTLSYLQFNEETKTGIRNFIIEDWYNESC